jgi:hypothetical protein
LNAARQGHGASQRFTAKRHSSILGDDQLGLHIEQLSPSEATGMPTTTEQQEIYVAIWAKAVDTQMHFNEMSVKSRQFGLAFVAASLGLGIVLLTRGQDYSIPIALCGGFDLNMTVIIAFAAAFALYAVMLLDLNVYYKMLRGAVAFNEDFERNYMKEIFALQKGMTEAISHYSRCEDAGADVQADGKNAYTGEIKKNAQTKIRKFYYVSIGTLFVVSVFLFFATAHFGRQGDKQAPAVKSSLEQVQPGAK